MAKKACPDCGNLVAAGKSAFCIRCGRRFVGGGRSVYQRIREETGLAPTEAIRQLSKVCRTKTDLALQLGVSRNSLYMMMRRFDIQDLNFKRG